MRTHLLEIVAAALLVAVPAHAATVVVKGGWFRALPAGIPAGGYFTLRNVGGDSVTLDGASSPACGMLMLHKSNNEGGTAMMMDIPSIKIAPGKEITFTPGDYHLMCMNPTAAIKPGGHVPVTLIFSDGSKITQTFDVKNATGH